MTPVYQPPAPHTPAYKEWRTSIPAASLSALYKVARQQQPAVAILLMSLCRILLFRLFHQPSQPMLINFSRTKGADANPDAAPAPTLLCYRVEVLPQDTLRTLIEKTRKEMENGLGHATEVLTDSIGFSFPPLCPALSEKNSQLPLYIICNGNAMDGLDLQLRYDPQQYDTELINTFGGQLTDRIVRIKEMLAPPPTTNQQQRILSELWQQVLHTKGFSPEIKFMEAGGNSMRMGRLINLIRDSFGVAVSFGELMSHPDIKSQELLIRRKLSMDNQKKIERSPFRSIFPLSFAQRIIYAADMPRWKEASYNVFTLFDVRGPLSVTALDTALAALLGNHESLRTCFYITETGELVQEVMKAPLIRSTTEVRPSADRDEAMELATAAIRTPFRISTAPLLKIYWFRYTADKGILLLVAHHLVCDGWSLELLFTELFRHYEDSLKTSAAAPVYDGLQYRDYVSWEQQATDEVFYKEMQVYWKAQLAGELPHIELPFASTRRLTQTVRNIVLPFSVNAELLGRLAGLNGWLNLSPTVNILTAVSLLIFRYTGQRDMILGIPVNVRDQTTLEKVIGLFINTVPLRIRIDPDTTVLDLMGYIHSALISLHHHSRYPLEKILADLPASTGPLFDVTVNYQSVDKDIMEGRQFAGLDIQMTLPPVIPAKYSLSFTIIESPTTLTGFLEYKEVMFPAHNMERLMTHFLSILDKLNTNLQEKVSNFSCLSIKESQQLNDWSHNENPVYDERMTADVLFASQAARDPQHPACISHTGDAITYGRLEELTGKFAHFLKNLNL